MTPDTRYDSSRHSLHTIAEDGSWEIIVKPPFSPNNAGIYAEAEEEKLRGFQIDGDIRLSAMRLHKTLGFPLLIEAEARGRHTFHESQTRSDWHIHVREAQYGRSPLRETVRIPQLKTDILPKSTLH